VGAAVARVLADEDVSLIAIDRDPMKVQQARRDGLAAWVGDASRPEILKLAGIASAEQLIVTVDDPSRAEAMVRAGRGLHPEMLILARAHDGEHAGQLQAAGARHVVPEAVESGLQMAGRALEGFGYETETVRDLLAAMRDEAYRKA
jgi:CPA2 family monovalent cation:H+ antiporter-2